MRRAAERAAAAGDYTTAIAELFRALARGLAERTVVTTHPRHHRARLRAPGRPASSRRCAARLARRRPRLRRRALPRRAPAPREQWDRARRPRARAAQRARAPAGAPRVERRTASSADASRAVRRRPDATTPTRRSRAAPRRRSGSRVARRLLIAHRHRARRASGGARPGDPLAADQPRADRRDGASPRCCASRAST